MRLILASASPRREELLRRLGVEFIVVPSAVDEPHDGPPRRRVLEAARRKALDVAARETGWVLAADTVVARRGRVLGKPASCDEAAAMLRHLSGKAHDVFTGLCLVETETGRIRAAVERTRVHFRPLSNREIDDYLASREYEDKAGAYAIQGRGACFVDWIRGDYTNVMGLPLSRLAILLRDVGADV